MHIVYNAHLLQPRFYFDEVVSFCKICNSLKVVQHYSKTFVKYYDILGWSEFSKKLLKKVEAFLHNKKSTYLDMACGTGVLACEISQKNKKIKVDAFDISKTMIEKATERRCNVNFFVDDITTFQKKDYYDMVTCFYDAINHVEGLELWEQTFGNVYKSLKTEGIFMFDFNTMIAKKNWDKDWENQSEKYKIIQQNINKNHSNSSKVKVTVFRNNTKLLEETFEEYFYPTVIKGIKGVRYL